ncbi:fat-body protein 1 [Ceratitis capitata]|nr:fat-body protein 1 [Ceratitis capitata]
MKTFVILLSCLVCCTIAGRHGLSQKLFGKSRYYGQQEQGYAAAGTSERQQFLLDVLLQVQKPLVNQQLIQLGEVLVTDASSYFSPNDVILQQFLQQASDREIIGRNGVYNPVDLSNIRQLVGLTRFFVLARNYNVFQRNVVYARLYFNPVMFVDALALAIRERPDTQDLVMPPMNEILPQLYYDNYVLSSAQNVDYNQLIDEATRINIKPSLFDIFGLRKIGALFQYGKYAHYNPTQQRYIPQRFGGYAQDYLGSEIQAKIVLPVEERNGNELTDDVDLNVAWNNLIIDQLAQTVIEDIQGGQQSGQQYYQGQQGSQQYYQGQGGQKYYQGQQGGQQYYQGQGSQKYYQGQQGGEQYYQGQGSQKYYQGQAGQQYYQGQGSQQYYQGQGGQKYYQGQQGSQQYYQGQQRGQQYYQGQQGSQQYYQGQQSGQQGGQYYPYGSYYGEQSEGIKQGLGSSEQLPQVDVDSPRLLHVGRRHRGDSQSAGYSYYVNPFYGYINRPYGLQGNQKYASGYYGQGYLYSPQEYQQSQYGYKNQGYSYGGQQNQGSQYGYKDQEYYYGPQEYQYGQYGNMDQGYYYGRQQNQGSQYGPYGYKNQGYYYGRYYGRQQDQGAQYGDNKYQSGQYYGQKSASYYGKPYGEQSQYGYDQQQYSYGQNQGSQYGYNGQAYSSAYVNPYSGQQYYYKNGEYGYGPQSQGQQQSYRAYPYGPQGIYNTKDYDEVIVLERVARDNRNRGEGSQRYQGAQGKQGSYRYTEQYRELEGLREGILSNIGATQQLSYARRGEILFQSIQQLAARLNIQRITETIEGNTSEQLEKQQQYQRVQQEIQQMIRLLRTLIEQVREEAGISADSEETLYVLSGIINGRIILEQQQQLSNSAQRTLQALQQQIQRIVENQVGPINEMTPLALLYGSLRNPVTQQAILSLAQLIDEYRQQLQPYTSYQLSSGGDIAVQNVQIEPLVTYTEYVDVDLVNLIDQQLLQSNANNLQQLGQKVVARQQRLNYEPFTIAMDIESQRQQDVSVRILLGPQVDYTGRRVSLAKNQRNFIVLDAFVQQLQSGVNNIQRNSRQFNGYSSDVTTISQIYRYIMTGQQQGQQQQQQGNGVIRQLPQNLLLPRGTQTNGGLPVQVMVVVTPLTQQDYYLRAENVLAQQISGLGIVSVGVDQLPLGYPLDRQIVDEQRLNVPNIQVVETVIRYESRTKA